MLRHATPQLRRAGRWQSSASVESWRTYAAAATDLVDERGEPASLAMGKSDAARRGEGPRGDVTLPVELTRTVNAIVQGEYKLKLALALC